MAKPRVTVQKRDERLQGLIDAGVIRKSSACDGKTRFTSQNDARHAAKLMAGEQRRDAVVYRCNWCGFHHISKKPHGDE